MAKNSKKKKASNTPLSKLTSLVVNTIKKGATGGTKKSPVHTNTVKRPNPSVSQKKSSNQKNYSNNKSPKVSNVKSPKKTANYNASHVTSEKSPRPITKENQVYRDYNRYKRVDSIYNLSTGAKKSPAHSNSLRPDTRARDYRGNLLPFQTRASDYKKLGDIVEEQKEKGRVADWVISGEQNSAESASSTSVKPTGHASVKPMFQNNVYSGDFLTDEGKYTYTDYKGKEHTQSIVDQDYYYKSQGKVFDFYSNRERNDQRRFLKEQAVEEARENEGEHRGVLDRVFGAITWSTPIAQALWETRNYENSFTPEGRRDFVKGFKEGLHYVNPFTDDVSGRAVVNKFWTQN